MTVAVNVWVMFKWQMWEPLVIDIGIAFVIYLGALGTTGIVMTMAVVPRKSKILKIMALLKKRWLLLSRMWLSMPDGRRHGLCLIWQKKYIRYNESVAEEDYLKIQ